MLFRNVSKKQAIIVSIIAFIAVVLSVVICMGHTESLVGMKVFDLKTIWGATYYQEFYNAMSSEAIDFYRFTQIPIDFFLAVMLSIFPLTWYNFLKTKVKIREEFFNIAACIAILDIIENIFLFILLSNGVNILPLATVTGIITLVKNLCMYFTYLMVVVYAIKYNKKK